MAQKTPSIPPRSPQSPTPGEIRSSRSPSVVINLTIDEDQWKALVRMRKAKGCKYEQELIRLFIAEGLEKAGYQVS